MKPNWIINNNPNSHLKYADISLDDWTWMDFYNMFKQEFCYGNVDDIWQILILNHEVRIYTCR